MNVFENLRLGKAYDVRDAQYLQTAHKEFDRCRHLCWLINSTDPLEKNKLVELERELFTGNFVMLLPLEILHALSKLSNENFWESLQ